MENQSTCKDPTNLILTIILIITLTANGIQVYLFNPFERFNWIISVISSKGNVIQVSNCNFNGNFYKINRDKILDNGWNEKNNSENGISNTFFPDNLSITWFSYNEQKFYDGNFSLPKETILTKAKQMGITYSKKDDYKVFLIAEVQPKGKVTVWVQKFDKNDNETKVKIGNYKAKEIKATWHIFDHYSESHTTSYINISKKVNLVMERYPYKLEIKLPDGFTLDDSYFEFINQKIWSFNEREPKTDSIINFLPKGFYLKWENGRKKFSTQFSFDEDKVLDSLEKKVIHQNPSFWN
ncbi:DUF2931 family protein [Flavobacterium sp. LBUM151]